MSRENIEVVRRLFDAFNHRNRDAMGDVWTSDCEWRPAYAGGGLMEGAAFRGHEGLVEFIDLQADTWESIVGDPVEMRDLGDQVLVKVHLQAVGRTSGIAVDRITWNVFRLRDGKIAAGHVYTAEEEALEVVGLSE
jgi:ketosteroid isomerase-like protein